MKDFSGVWVAMVSPWNKKKREPDHVTIEGLVTRLSDTGIAGLFILGTTGEGTLLSPEDRKRFAESVVTRAGRLPVIVHTGHDRTEVAYDLSRHAAKIGAAGVAAAPPCRYRFTAEELQAHYLEIASAAGDLPFFLYDIPATTGNPLSASLLTALRTAAANVVGAKISRGDWEAWEGYLDVAEEFTLLVGKDEMGFPLLLLGGSGLVSSCANIFPELYVALYHAAMNGDIALGRKIQELITELCRVTRRGHVPTIKRALSIMGQEVGDPLPPLRPLPPAENSGLSAQLTAIQTKAAQWVEKGG